jgi:hypothetical protein
VAEGEVADVFASLQSVIEKAGGTFEKTPVPLKQSTKEAEKADK